MQSQCCTHMIISSLCTHCATVSGSRNQFTCIRTFATHKHPLLQLCNSAVRLPLCHAQNLTTKLLTFWSLPPNIGEIARTGTIHLILCNTAQIWPESTQLGLQPILALSASWLNIAASSTFLKASLRLYSRHIYHSSKAKHARRARRHTGGQTTGKQ